MPLYDIHNPARSKRIIHPRGVASDELCILPGETKRGVEILSHVLPSIQRASDLVIMRMPPPNGHIEATVVELPAPPVTVDPKKPIMVIDGMYGIGDNLHQRAVLRELMKTHDVWLISCHFTLYWDLIELGLKVLFKPTRLRAQARTIARERHLFHNLQPPTHQGWKKIWYNKPDIDKHGSILMSMFGEFGLKPERPDFSLPLKPAWREAARKLIAQWKPTKPLIVLRPVVRRMEWDGDSRNPDTGAYDQIYRSIRDRFFVVSVADLEDSKEWIVGPKQEVDVALHKAELDFGTMAGLWAEAAMVFTPAGFGPVLAQAVGTPSIVVYGGRESFKTTQVAGAHLAPTLGIDPIHPCDCHSHRHGCDKRIDVPKAIERALHFVNEHGQSRGVADRVELPLNAGIAAHPPLEAPACRQDEKPRILVFATTYVDCKERAKLTEQWLSLHMGLNGEDCDFLIVDSASPFQPLIPEGFTAIPYVDGISSRLMLHSFPDNVGHLSRGGRDGWGRAFSFGLQAAIDGLYDYVVHIEGDSLFKRKIRPIIDHMKREKVMAASTPVKGMIRDLAGWVETGLMFFDVEFIQRTRLVERYNWPLRKAAPTPEVVIRNLLSRDLAMMPWKALRGDKQQITHENVLSLNLDWLTHCHNDVWAYDRFFESAMKGVEPGAGKAVASSAAAGRLPIAAPKTPVLEPPRPLAEPSGPKLNFGCGENRLGGWRNMDSEVDISKPLPFETESAAYIFAEHVVEHIPHKDALDFFKECHRVLVPGGVLRIAVPSIEQIMASSDEAYFRFTEKWQRLGPTRRGAMQAILYAHGHETAWTASLLDASLYFAGFEKREQRKPGASTYAALRGVEGHHKVIGEAFNAIETLIFEAVKDGEPPVHVVAERRRVAIVVGGAENVMAELAWARELCREANAEPTFIAINDCIPLVPEDIIPVTLHPERLERWLAERASKNLPMPAEIWAHRKHQRVTHATDDWGGSSGLFAVKLAKEKGFERIILCGVPMRQDAGHVVRHSPWGACRAFEGGWKKHKAEIAPLVRSYSGWTRELFGEPSLEFLSR